MGLTLSSIKAAGGSRRCRVVRRRNWRDLVAGDAVEHARELARGGAAMAARFWRFETGRGRGKEWRPPRRVVAVLKAPWSGRWGQGRRTGATASPRVGEALWPVGHSPFTDELNEANGAIELD
jgi:hypothetical protein